ncbi:bacterio-opsin activator domain-containing protein [Halostella salina]|uniref:bacterio-opsin activator domain-containing protein n=1 Tax=Halostella salina TaxID=1547897 RepID=UPI000EF766FD|nr:bacterio-opsin activator domain-containing protein [Halostella salina]
MSSLATPHSRSTRPHILYVGGRTDIVAAAAEQSDAVLANPDDDSRSAVLDGADGTVDCLLVDATLPDGSGVELLDAARQTRPDLAGVVLVDSEPVPDIGTDPPTDYARVADGPDALAARVSGVLARGESGESPLADLLLDRTVRQGRDPILVVDDRAEVRFANAAVEGVFGYEPSEVVGSDVADLVRPERREAFLDSFARCVAGGATGGWVDASVSGHHRDGRTVPLSVSVHAARRGDERLFIAIVRDVTEQREREATLERQRDELAELDRINRVIREVARVLVDAASRTEIERAVCDGLAESGPYTFAWIGRENLARNTVVPRVQAGAADGYLDAVTSTVSESLSDRGPAGQAVRDRTVTVVDDITADERFEPWRDAALSCGLRSAAVVPIQYDETVFGVVALYEDAAEAFDERETAVLEELGRMIGHAMTAVDRKEALVADERTELEFRLTDDDYFFTGVTAGTDVGIVFDGMTPRTDGSDLVYVTVHDGSPDAVRAAAAEASVVEDATLVRDHGDRCCFEFATTDDTVAATLASYGASVASMTAANGTARITVELPTTADVRSLVQAVTAEFDGMELLAQREHRGTDGDDRDPSRDATDLLGLLTERQRAVLETAYRSGYFEWPRDRTAEEVAGSLDIASPTLHNHLRLAQSELFGALFEGD